ncbi:unnamed protein product, partial [Mesorhabditis belari]|uniref:V-type proton ATPase proteolipid subunit n=1 Tax=Mesorhabditis belari TaxID=2138241 RepID=A0AAF3J6Y8_9BILA
MVDLVENLTFDINNLTNATNSTSGEFLARFYYPPNPSAPPYAPFFGFMGCTAAQVFTVLGAAYGTAKSAVGISQMAVTRPELIMKSIIPVIMAGIIAIYGLVVAMVIKGKIGGENYTLYAGFSHMAAGLTCGLCGLGAGFAIGIVGDAGVRGTAQQPRLFVGMILILIFSEMNWSVLAVWPVGPNRSNDILNLF